MGYLSNAIDWFKGLGGTATGAQSATGTNSASDMMAALLAQAGGSTGLQGYREPPEATIATFRKMFKHPTVAICRAASTAGIRAAEFSIEADPDAPEGAADFIDGMIEPLWAMMKSDALFALDYGRAPFEKIYSINERGYFTLDRLKPLNVAKTEIVADPETGDYVGLKNGKANLPAEKTWLFVYGSECGSLEGRSKLTNVIVAWNMWDSIIGSQGRVFEKAAAVIPVVNYPEGDSKNEAGVSEGNFQIAQRILARLYRGHGVAMPKKLVAYADDMIRQGVDPSQLSAWSITFLTPDGSVAGPILEGARYADELIMRGMFVVAGAISNEQVGSQAKAQSAADLTMAMQEQDKSALVSAINRHVIDDVLVLNWGESARGTVRLTVPPLVDAVRDAQRRIIETLLTGIGGVQLLEQATDLEKAIQDATGFSPPEDVEPVAGEVTPAGDGSLPTDTALNSAQVTSAVTVCQGVTAGTIAPGAAVELLTGVGFTPAQAQAMVDASKNATPAEATPPAAVIPA